MSGECPNCSPVASVLPLQGTGHDHSSVLRYLSPESQASVTMVWLRWAPDLPGDFRTT